MDILSDSKYYLLMILYEVQVKLIKRICTYTYVDRAYLFPGVANKSKCLTFGWQLRFIYSNFKTFFLPQSRNEYFVSIIHMYVHTNKNIYKFKI